MAASSRSDLNFLTFLLRTSLRPSISYFSISTQHTPGSFQQALNHAVQASNTGQKSVNRRPAHRVRSNSMSCGRLYLTSTRSSTIGLALLASSGQHGAAPAAHQPARLASAHEVMHQLESVTCLHLILPNLWGAGSPAGPPHTAIAHCEELQPPAQAVPCCHSMAHVQAG